MTVPLIPDPSLAADLLNRSSALLAHANLQGRLVYVNPAWAGALGRDAQTLVGTTFADLAHADDRPAVGAVLARMGGPGAAADGGEHRFAHADGSWRRLRWRATPAGAPDQGLHLAADELGLGTEELAAVTRERDALARELDDLASSLSHDVRAPLRAIDGFAQILLADHADAMPADTRRFLDVVRAASGQVAVLLDDLMSVARVSREPLDPRDGVDLARLAREVVDLVLRPRQGGRDVSWSVADLPPCRCDPRLARRLLEELLDNALKFTATHAAARIDVGYDAGAGAYFVRDDGVGFDDALIERAYGIFARLHQHDAYAGTGVGLALAARVVDRHGGRLWGRSRPGEGATFWFTLGKG